MHLQDRLLEQKMRDGQQQEPKNQQDQRREQENQLVRQQRLLKELLQVHDLQHHNHGDPILQHSPGPRLQQDNQVLRDRILQELPVL